MRTNNLKAILKAAVRVLAILPFAACVALGQQTGEVRPCPARAPLRGIEAPVVDAPTSSPPQS